MSSETQPVVRSTGSALTRDRAAVVLPGGLFGPHAPLLMYSADAAEPRGARGLAHLVVRWRAPPRSSAKSPALSSGSSTTSYGLNGTVRPGTHEGARRSPIVGYDKVAAKLASSVSPTG